MNRTLKLAVGQTIPKLSTSESLQHLAELATEAASHGADALILPELFLGGYLLENVHSRAVKLDGPELEQAAALALETGVTLIFGLAEAELDPSGIETHFNTALALEGGTGQVLMSYRKTRLFGDAEKAAFHSGNQLGQVFAIKGVCCCLLICYDVEFPEAVRTCALAGTELLLVPTANMVPYNTVNTCLVRSRALENHIHVTYCNWSSFTSGEGVQFNGESSVVAPDGTVLAAFAADEDSLRYAQIVVPNEVSTEDNYLADRRPTLYRI